MYHVTFMGIHRQKSWVVKLICDLEGIVLPQVVPNLCEFVSSVDWRVGDRGLHVHRSA